MAVEQYGDTWEIVRLSDGSFLITTTDVPVADDEISFAFEFGGEVCWGDDNPDEVNIRDFTGNITAGANYYIAGSGDAEKVYFNSGGYIELETWNYGSGQCKITRDKYETGSGSVTIKYKTGATEAACDAVETWTEYTAPFTCTGWAKVRVEV